MRNIKVLLPNDTFVTLPEWQKLYGLNASEDQIGKFFFASEKAFADNLSEYGELIVSSLLIKVLDVFRVKCGRALHINSFNRSEEHQKGLKAKGFKAATYSPHVVFLAADIDTTNDSETNVFVKLLVASAKELDIKIRYGYKQYQEVGQTFIHVDVCPEYYGPGKPRHTQTHPVQWELPYSNW